MITFVVTAFLLIFFWQSIASFILNTLIPWVTQTLGPVVRDVFKQVVAFLDKAVKWTRLQIKKAWAWLKTRLMSMKSVYKFPSPGVCIRVTTTYIVSEEGNVIENVTEEKLDWDEMPSDVRKEFLKVNSDSVEVDVKTEVLESRFKNVVAEQEGLTDKEVLDLLQ